MKPLPLSLPRSAAVVFLCLILWAGCSTPALWPEPQLESRAILPAVDSTGFTRATGPREFSYPADHGPHLDFQTEWWYYTGNLETTQGRRFGYQLTFFRRALVPPDSVAERPSKWATQQVYMAHFALTDVENGRHQAFERFSRSALDLAGAEISPYHVWLGDWRITQRKDMPQAVRLIASEKDASVELLLIDRKGPVLHGDQGYSKKGPGPGNASYYYSQPRIETSGTVRTADTVYQVTGWSWMDHEFSTGALSRDQVGWDWFALRLDDGTDLMVFQIRQGDGTISSSSSGSLVGPEGTSHHLAHDSFNVEVTDTWRSPHSGASYPTRWRVRVPSANLELQINPYVRDQEMTLSYTYWEGAVSITGERNGNPVVGDGYVEMTGYAGSMGEQF